MGASPTITADNIARQFCGVYYEVARCVPNRLSQFYGPDSVIAHGTVSAVGEKEIASVASRLPLINERATIHSLTAQTTASGAYLVVTAGSLGSDARRFAQTFVLEHKVDSHLEHFYCRNDIFCFVPDPSHPATETVGLPIPSAEAVQPSGAPDNAEPPQSVDKIDKPSGGKAPIVVKPSPPTVAAASPSVSPSRKLSADAAATTVHSAKPKPHVSEASAAPAEDVTASSTGVISKEEETPGSTGSSPAPALEKKMAKPGDAKAPASSLHPQSPTTVQTRDLKKPVSPKDLPPSISAAKEDAAVEEVKTSASPSKRKTWASIVSAQKAQQAPEPPTSSVEEVVIVEAPQATADAKPVQEVPKPRPVSQHFKTPKIKENGAAPKTAPSAANATVLQAQGQPSVNDVDVNGHQPGNIHSQNHPQSNSNQHHDRHSQVYHHQNSLNHGHQASANSSHGQAQSEQSHFGTSYKTGQGRNFGPSAVVQLASLGPERQQQSVKELIFAFREEFAQYGHRVRHVEVKMAKGIAFIEYDSQEGVQAAVAAWANGPRTEGRFAGVQLAVSGKRSSYSRRPGSMRSRGGPGLRGRRGRPTSSPAS